LVRSRLSLACFRAAGSVERFPGALSASIPDGGCASGQCRAPELICRSSGDRCARCSIVRLWRRLLCVGRWFRVVCYVYLLSLIVLAQVFSVAFPHFSLACLGSFESMSYSMGRSRCLPCLSSQLLFVIAGTPTACSLAAVAASLSSLLLSRGICSYVAPSLWSFSALFRAVRAAAFLGGEGVEKKRRHPPPLFNTVQTLCLPLTSTCVPPVETRVTPFECPAFSLYPLRREERIRIVPLP